MVVDPGPSEAANAPAMRVLPVGFSGDPPSAPWVLWRLITCRKTPRGRQTNQWSRDPIPTRFSPYPKPRPLGRHMEWRAVRAEAGPHVFVVLCMVQAVRNDFSAWLVLEHGQIRSVIERWEYHGAHKLDGVHSHSWCATASVPTGPQSINAPVRLPGPRNHHRRSGIIWSKEKFWIAACRRFAVDLADINQGVMVL